MKIEEYKEGALCPNCMIPLEYKFSETEDTPTTYQTRFRIVARICVCPKCHKHWRVKE